MQRACLVRVLKWEPRTSVPSFSPSPHCKEGLSHLASVFASIHLSCTQHGICHLLYVGFGTVLIRQELEVHTLEIFCILDCGSGGKRVVSRCQLSPFCPSSTPSCVAWTRLTLARCNSAPAGGYMCSPAWVPQWAGRWASQHL